MDESALTRYTSRFDAKSSESADSEQESIEDLVAFGWLRGMDARAVMLDLRRRNGNRLGIAYSWISQISVDPTTGIVLVAGNVRVAIVGRGLVTEVQPGVTLYDGLLRHRISWIQEATTNHAFIPLKSTCCVEGIAW